MDTQKPRSIFDLFTTTQETFEEAKKKNSDESSKRISYLRFSKDGTYNLRILPLAPNVDANGDFVPSERKGYEYPLRSLMLKIENNKGNNGKPGFNYVTVCNAKYVFKGLENDLIDTYVATVCDKYASDEALCKKIRSNSFSGGLKWDSRRCMYVIDMDNKGDGIQMLQLSYAQYKDIEERKLNLWAKLNKNGKIVDCPISSPLGAYPIEIIRKTENDKPSYSYNIDTIGGVAELDEATLEQLMDLPRIPEQIYRYTRYHLEATIAYLSQLDEKFDIDVVNSAPVQDCIAQIKHLLPADDQSHFKADNKDSADTDSAANLSIDELWKRYDTLCAEGFDDRSPEGQDLRTLILTYIDAHKLDVEVNRKKTNEDILNEIEDEMANNNATSTKPSVSVQEDEDEDSEPAMPSAIDDEDEDSEPSVPVSDNVTPMRSGRRAAHASTRRSI